MIRCNHETIERSAEKKGLENRERPFVALRRLDFDTMLFRDGAAWDRITSAEALVKLTDRIKKELVPSDFQRFVNHFCATHGAGLVRAAGLPISPMQVAS